MLDACDLTGSVSLHLEGYICCVLNPGLALLPGVSVHRHAIINHVVFRVCRLDFIKAHINISQGILLRGEVTKLSGIVYSLFQHGID